MPAKKKYSDPIILFPVSIMGGDEPVHEPLVWPTKERPVTRALDKVINEMTLSSPCRIEDDEFFGMLNFIEGKFTYLEKDKILVKEFPTIFNLQCKKDISPEEMSLSLKNAIKLKEKRSKWLGQRGYDNTSVWMCNYIQRTLNIPMELKVQNYFPCSGNSLVVITVADRDNKEYGIMITRVTGDVSIEQPHIREVLSKHNLAAKIYSTRTRGEFIYSDIEIIPRSLDSTLLLFHVRQEYVPSRVLLWVNVIRTVIKRLAYLKITHGALVLSNMGHNYNGQIKLLNFNRSSITHYTPGFDLAFLLHSMQPSRMTLYGHCTNLRLVRGIIRQLIPDVTSEWMTKDVNGLRGKYPDSEKIVAFGDNWGKSAGIS